MSKKKKNEGMKFDGDKARWDLIPWSVIDSIKEHIDSLQHIKSNEDAYELFFTGVSECRVNMDSSIDCALGILWLMCDNDNSNTPGGDGWINVPWDQISKLADVYTYGANKYAPNNWQNVEEERYFSAMMRHITSHIGGEACDKESGIEHLTHALWNALTLKWKYDKQSDKGTL